MWRRHRRRTLAPRRPAVLPEQWLLVAFTVAAIAFGLAVVAIVLVG